MAPSASGKGILSYIRLLVEPIHDEIRKEVAIQMKAYKKEKAEYDAMGKERTKKEAPQMPPNRMFLISGNNTGTGILQNIMAVSYTHLDVYKRQRLAGQVNWQEPHSIQSMILSFSIVSKSPFSDKAPSKYGSSPIGQALTHFAQRMQV